MIRLFFRKGAPKILLALYKYGGTYAYKLRKITGIDHTHIHKILKDFLYYGLINKKTGTGKIKILTLTDKGSELAQLIENCLRFRI